MKKTLFLSFIGLTSLASAQSVKFGVKAGVNFATETASISGVSITSDTYTSFHFGAIADIGLQNFSIQPGVLFSVKGSSSTNSSGTSLTYIEVPVNLLYHIPAGPGKVFFGAGPYLGYGISASNGVSFGSTTDKVANPDFGLNLLGGYRLNSGLLFSAGYGLGLANLINNGNGATLKNRVTSISIGYFF